ncbi:hypothetical protein [Kiloniella sp. b19]|uniref:hypothetical protein n=1 Tax=Kiloniella sp. GXU_MW_B19 TaxID=3141326 RepID=UPI0031E4816F
MLLNNRKVKRTAEIPWAPFVDGLMAVYLVIIVVTVFFVLVLADELRKKDKSELILLVDGISEVLEDVNRQSLSEITLQLLPNQEEQSPVVFVPIAQGQNRFAFYVDNIEGALREYNLENLLKAALEVKGLEGTARLRFSYSERIVEKLGYQKVFAFAYKLEEKLKESGGVDSFEIGKSADEQHDIVITLGAVQQR